ncbi:hypothetical protein B0H14DRAFT_3645148 [Mycena olivaceomarginata]|nr:hypothetical protein B0H14DRAFT_3645148 [Mycena olivaceomarginata]
MGTCTVYIHSTQSFPCCWYDDTARRSPYDTAEALKAHIGTARRAVTETYRDAHAHIQCVVSRWISAENRVEARLNSLLPPHEPLLPGALYAAIALLATSTLMRHRALPCAPPSRPSPAPPPSPTSSPTSPRTSACTPARSRTPIYLRWRTCTRENAIPPTMARKFDGRDVNQSDSHVSLKDFTHKDFKPPTSRRAHRPRRARQRQGRRP